MTEQQETSAAKPGHEPVSISVRGLLIAAAGLVLLVVVTLGAMNWLRSALSPEQVQKTTELEVLPEEDIETPLDPDQRAQRLRSEQQQTEQLSQYQWLDRDREKARIPIERAMELTVERYQSSKKEEQP